MFLLETTEIYCFQIITQTFYWIHLTFKLIASKEW
jgi:hypothetical protein